MSHSNSSGRSLIFGAGAAARREIEANGFRPAKIGTLAGASGGAKWLALSQLDRVVARRILPHLEGPVHTIATSIGAWRFACYAQADPVAAIDRFEDAYLSQTYSEKPDREEITALMMQMLKYIVSDQGMAEILAHPVLRMHVMVVRTRGVLATENRLALAAGLLAVASANMASRQLLGRFCDRVLFHDPRDLPPFHSMPGFPMYHVPMTPDNLRESILATSAIPLVIAGVRDIQGAPQGMYRDGGVIDYHLDFPHSHDDKLSLYLHFYNIMKPGWFDKRLSWRSADPVNTDRTLLISPSPEFVAKLPNGKIPDRTDFTTMPPAERERAWRTTVAACQQMADELEEVLEKDCMAERLQPIGN